MCLGHAHLLLVAIQFHIDEPDFQRYVESALELQAGFDEVEAQLLGMRLFLRYVNLRMKAR